MSSSSSIPKEALGKIKQESTCTAATGKIMRKRLSPFRIKVGCVVALRYQPGTGNHVTMIVPPDTSTNDDSQSQSGHKAVAAVNINKPSKHPLLSLVGLESHVEVWTDPIPGRDEGLALIGRRVRCCFTRQENNSNTLGRSAGEKNHAKNNDSSKENAARKTKNYIVEGEVVSILNYFSKEWREKRGRQRRKRGDASFPSFAVELLIDRDLLAKVSFLERTDEDIDINQLKKESAKRAHRNEEAIKGKNKITVRVSLADPSGVVTHAENSGSTTSFQPDVAKWAVRKRIPNKPGQPLVTTKKDDDSSENQPAAKLAATKNQSSVVVPISDKTTTFSENSMGTSDNKDAKGQGLGGDKITNNVPTKSGASGGKPQLKMDTTQNTTTQKHSRDVAGDSSIAKKKRKSNGIKKSANAPTQYLGDGNDDPVQQQRNWRWLAARYYDMYLANLKASPSATTICNRMNTNQFYDYYSELLASCGGLVGEVLEVTPSSRSGTLAMVTIRRLILPEHTATGRLALHNKDDGMLQIFDDYDSTLIGKIRRAENAGEQNFRNGHDENNSHDFVLFRVPIEQLVIVSRQMKRNFQNQTPDPGSSDVPDELCVFWSYSLRSGCRIPLKCTVSKSGNVQPVPRPLNKKKLRKLCLCHRCRTWVPQSQATVCDNENCLRVLPNLPFQEESADENDKKYQVFWCEACLETLRSFDSIAIGRPREVVQPSTFPCCAGWCDCRQCQSMTLPEMAHSSLASLTRDSTSLRTDGDTSESLTRVSGEDQVLSFSDEVSCVLSMSVSNFDLPKNLIDLSFLPPASSKPVTKVTLPSASKKRKKPSSDGCKAAVERRRKDAATPPRKKLRASSPRPRTPPPMSGVARAPLWRMSEDYSVFKPSCSRLLDYKTVAATKALHDDSSHREPQLLIGHHCGDRPRNLRELVDKISLGESGDKDEKTTSSRALRVSQRRLVKDVALLGASSLSLDTLAGRESQLRFDRSGIHAWGVFADGEISAGDMIVEYRGELIGNAMAEKREREYELAKIGSDYMFRIDGLTVCDATKQGNVARFINASCDPNCYTKIITLDGKQRIVIYAKKDIKAGEELCYDYKFPIEYDESKRIPCYCGARECRGYMNWDKRYVAMPARPNEVGGSLKAKSALGQCPLLPVTGSISFI